MNKWSTKPPCFNTSIKCFTNQQSHSICFFAQMKFNIIHSLSTRTHNFYSQRMTIQIKGLNFFFPKSFFYHQSSIWLRTIVWSNFKPLVSMLRVCPRPASIFYREIVLFHFPHVEMKYCLLSTRHMVCN